MSELAVRTLSGVAMIAVALAAAAKGGNVFAVGVGLVAMAIYYEWTRLARGWGAIWWVTGFLYALIPALALLWIRERDASGLYLLLWTFIVTWSTDIGAYFVGRAVGKRKLAPAISPGKTVAGFWGGVAAAALLGGAWALLTGLGVALLFLAPLFGVAAQGGDLFESWMKRRAGVKDSGSWLPGHGGVLDRLDGLVPVAVLTAMAQIGGLT
ncbi:phosphatidate cytidylyltransferase [Sphingomonas lutea]|uniref:Phosphatidate cytidylyltransferase n=1 Tax=Sphingomonas lutea TaxID=1045317 RepID=A0A7G9SFN9_9SPHN|nr:phosphatidate cytidylyltransferase [Sphingomonas lutea]QNN66664.1 phosphatidate cytidylyltransferase [Sphingomonas lutea]